MSERKSFVLIAEITTNIADRSNKVPKSSIFWEDDNNIPGPGSYDGNLLILKNTSAKFSIGNLTQHQVKEPPIPGPGNYDVSFASTQKCEPQFSFRNRESKYERRFVPFSHRITEKPDPCSYQPNFNYVQTTAPSYQVSEKTKDLHDKELHISPQRYQAVLNPDSIEGRLKNPNVAKCSLSSRDDKYNNYLTLPFQTPGPGKYNPNSSITQRQTQRCGIREHYSTEHKSKGCICNTEYNHNKQGDIESKNQFSLSSRWTRKAKHH